MVARTIVLFALAASTEIGGAWLIWQGVRERRGLLWIGAGLITLGIYGFVATMQHDPHFGRLLAAYGGVFVAGSLAWGVIFDGFRPDRWDIIGALICLLGVGVIMFAPSRPSAGDDPQTAHHSQVEQRSNSHDDNPGNSTQSTPGTR